MRTRTSLASWLTRHCCDVRNALAINDCDAVYSTFVKLSESFNKLCNINSEILNSFNGPEQVKSIDENGHWFEKYYQKFIDCANDVSKFRQLKAAPQAFSVENKVDEANTAKVSDLHCLIDENIFT